MLELLTLAADDPYAMPDAGGMGTTTLILYIAWYVLMSLGMFKCYQKAKHPNAWMGFVPILQLVPLLEIAGKPVWWIVLFLIPLVGLVMLVLTLVDFTPKYGKGAGFAVGLLLLGIIFWPILGFGDAQYGA